MLIGRSLRTALLASIPAVGGGTAALAQGIPRVWVQVELRDCIYEDLLGERASDFVAGAAEHIVTWMSDSIPFLQFTTDPDADYRLTLTLARNDDSRGLVRDTEGHCPSDRVDEVGFHVWVEGEGIEARGGYWLMFRDTREGRSVHARAGEMVGDVASALATRGTNGAKNRLIYGYLPKDARDDWLGQIPIVLAPEEERASVGSRLGLLTWTLAQAAPHLCAARFSRFSIENDVQVSPTDETDTEPIRLEIEVHFADALRFRARPTEGQGKLEAAIKKSLGFEGKVTVRAVYVVMYVPRRECGGDFAERGG